MSKLLSNQKNTSIISLEYVQKRELVGYSLSSLTKDPLFRKMHQLKIFCENEQRVKSLTLGRLVSSKMATRRKQGGDVCSDLSG